MLYQLVPTISCKGLALSLACLWQFSWDIVKTNMFESVTWPQSVCWAEHLSVVTVRFMCKYKPRGWTRPGPGGGVLCNIIYVFELVLYYIRCTVVSVINIDMFTSCSARLQLTSDLSQVGAVKQLSKLKTILLQDLTDIKTNTCISE